MRKLEAAVTMHRDLLTHTAGCSEGAAAEPQPAEGAATPTPQRRCPEGGGTRCPRGAALPRPRPRSREGGRGRRGSRARRALVKSRASGGRPFGGRAGTMAVGKNKRLTKGGKKGAKKKV